MSNLNDLSKEKLIEIIEDNVKTIKSLTTKVEELSLLIAMKNSRTFMKSQEKIDKEEINLFNFNEVEQNSSITLDEAKSELKTNTPRKAKSKNHEEIDFEKFVTETIIHDVSNGNREDYIEIGSDITYKADVAVKISVTKHIYKTVKEKSSGVISSTPRNFPFNNSIATPSFVSYIANEKYLMGTPLYRQEMAFSTIGFPQSRINLSNYLMKGAVLLEPFYNYLTYLLINNEKKVIHADETTLKVLSNKNREKSYMWLYTTSMNDKPIYIYEYRYSRSGKWPREFLNDYSGYLVADDYGGYNHIPNVTVQKCMVHARRKFFDIYKANKDPNIKYIISLIDDIFKMEKYFITEKLSKENIESARNKSEYLKTLYKYFDHLESLNYSPTSITGKAISYSLKNKEGLLVFLNDGNIPIHNNLAERGIKPFVINRKNFLFSNTEKGARASSIYMSIIQSAKASGLDTNKYLKHLFEELHKNNIIYLNLSRKEEKTKAFNLMKDLLPWSDKIESLFKMKEVSR